MSDTMNKIDTRAPIDRLSARVEELINITKLQERHLESAHNTIAAQAETIGVLHGMWFEARKTIKKLGKGEQP